MKKLLFYITIVLVGISGVYLAKNATNFFSKAGGTYADLKIDINNLSQSNETISVANFAQGGEERGRMLLPVTSKLKMLSPAYIRIDHIYDNYNLVSKDGSGNIIFSWTNLDQTISDILATGAKPFISLSYMPPAISSGDVIDLPSNWSDWELIIQKTVEHISGKSGLNISNVYYEVWNEPDLFGKFKTSGEKNYLDLYLHSALGASRATNVNPYKIGGPATTEFYPNWMKNLLNFTGNSGIRIDFFSWHRYSKNLDDYESDGFEAKRTLLEEFPEYGNLELIISEMGPNSKNDPVYDNSFSAVHLIATAAVLKNQVSKVFHFEVKDGPGSEKLWGRWGFFTHEKWGEPEAKPRVQAVKFLNKMRGSNINVRGEGTWVKSIARNDGVSIKTLVVNYDTEGKHFEAVPITFENLPWRNFIFRKTTLFGATKDISVATTSATWQTLQPFEANSAAIFEILPQ